MQVSIFNFFANLKTVPEVGNKYNRRFENVSWLKNMVGIDMIGFFESFNFWYLENEKLFVSLVTILNVTLEKPSWQRKEVGIDVLCLFRRFKFLKFFWQIKNVSEIWNKF